MKNTTSSDRSSVHHQPPRADTFKPKARRAAVPTRRAQDVERMRALEAEAALYRHALEKAREELQSFAYSVSHDLRAPIRAIEGFSKILADDFRGQLPAEAERFLRHLIANARQLGAQIDDLLKFYRAAKNPPSRVQTDPNLILDDVIAELKPDIPISRQRLPAVMADPAHLSEVFAQLISNAVKACSGVARPRIEVGCKKEPNAVTFFVRDTGIGFDGKSGDRLFQVFQKLHGPSTFPGNGVGLAIVRRLVEAHAGCVRAEGKTGGGATFYFTLPR